MADFQLYSFNVRGIRDKVKRKIIFQHLLKKYPKGIYLLQETHSTLEIELEWEKEWGGDIHYCHGTNDARGVAILTAPDLDFNVSVIQKDNMGRFIAVKIVCTDSQEYTICNIYAPTRNKVQEQLTFFSAVKDTVAKFDSCNLVMGGDFNTIFDPDLDKQGGITQNCINEYTHELVAFMEANDLVDAIRLNFPEKKIFTRIQRKPPVLTRIDHWLVSSHLVNYMKCVNVYPGLKSDHSIIYLNISQVNVKRGRGFWKFNSMLLQDKDYTCKVVELIESLRQETDFFTDRQLRWDYIKLQIRSFTLKYASQKNKEKQALKTNLESE